MFEGKKIIVGRDKMDTVSGITHKLDAFECFLKEYPEWRNKVVLVQISQPGQIRDAKLEAKISERVTQINSIYGSLEFVPVHFHRTYIENDKYLALLNIADLGLIMSVRSGMNTVSLEYIACQNEKHSPLILSEFTGTAGSMCGAIQTNPWNMYSVASSINKALLMSEVEKEQRHKQMYAYVYSHNSELWASSFINSIRKNFAQYDISNTKELDRLMISSRYRTSSKRLLLLDYDGTLTPITNIPSMALLDEETVHTLASLCKDERNTVWVISGRDIEFLDKHMGHIKGLGMSGEHGGFIRNPHGEWISLVERLDLSWMPKIKSIFEFYTERTKGSFIEEKKAAITWHYRNADPEYGTFQCNQCMDYLEGVIASNMPVEVVVGKKCLEVRPSVVNKGEIVSRILNSNPSDSPYDFVFVAGDDRTDEDMFKAINDFVAEQNQIPSFPNLLPNNTSGTLKPCMSSASLSQSLFQPDAADQNYFTVLVGPPNKKTSAAWSVRSSKELTDFFATLT
ncbi:Trehalose-phosphatase [Zancudomyces culisetae]|uniref:Trehalose-phosphatase n=1 Tax=Zancudomyces culisetae TaxID=1213189 RepID=A0A1R1PQW3_ZANCU|nr:Trehalose-phosphatase [Zancudomyces culisetae]OMH84749.1 Trehalose-phosphatase [Zancudomyces culisetae]|eukprot:OMH83376.1 Trehalose-phosphatase [Zancudomyces culisetae]